MRRGQSIPEYAVLISLVAAAILALQVYLRRGIQAQIKKLTDTALAVTPDDATSANLAKRGEKTQKMGMEGGGSSVSVQHFGDQPDLVVSRQVGGITTYEGLGSQGTSNFSSVFVDKSEVPPQFLLRSRVFGQLTNVGKDPIQFFPTATAAASGDQAGGSLSSQ